MSKLQRDLEAALEEIIETGFIPGGESEENAKRRYESLLLVAPCSRCRGLGCERCGNGLEPVWID